MQAMQALRCRKQIHMTNDARFNEAILLMDDANALDPRRTDYDGGTVGRELAFSRRVYAAVQELVDDASEELLLAARGHTLRRWEIPRDTYPKTTLGYHEWRDALAKLHADAAATILADVEYAPETIGRVKDLILRKRWPEDADARTLEDADCIVFLQTKLAEYLDVWDENKTVHILRRTLGKMTPEGREKALGLELGPRAQKLVARARAGMEAS